MTAPVDGLLSGLLLFADRRLRREHALVDGASFPNETGPLELGLRNKSDNFTHIASNPNWRTRIGYAMSNIIPISKIGATGPNCTPSLKMKDKKPVTALRKAAEPTRLFP